MLASRTSFSLRQYRRPVESTWSIPGNLCGSVDRLKKKSLHRKLGRVYCYLHDGLKNLVLPQAIVNVDQIKYLVSTR